MRLPHKLPPEIVAVWSRALSSAAASTPKFSPTTTKKESTMNTPTTADTHFLQPKITGYRQLSETEVALMNEGKALAEQCGAFIAKLRNHPDLTSIDGMLPPKMKLDQRWISIGSTDLQTGFMAVIRGIAQPTTF